MICCVSKYMYTLNIIWVHVTGSDECFNVNSVASQGQATNRLDTNDIYPVYTTSINHASTVVKSLLREFLNHTGTPKQGSTIMVASAHISDSIYTCN